MNPLIATCETLRREAIYTVFVIAGRTGNLPLLIRQVDTSGGANMAGNNRLKEVAVKIGSAAGRIDGKTHRAAHVAMQELDELTKNVDALKKQLKRSTQNLKSALR